MEDEIFGNGNRFGVAVPKKRKTGERKIVIHKRKEKEDFREREKESFMIFQKKKEF